jgi:hypothetical protein
MQKKKRQERTMSEDKMTFWDLIIGIILFFALFSIVGVALAENKLAFFLGTLFGSIVALGLCTHMYKTLEVTLDMSADKAEKRSYAMTGVRLVIMGAAVLAAIFLSERISLLGVILGILTLKLSALVQPLLHKRVTRKLFDKGG